MAREWILMAKHSQGWVFEEMEPQGKPAAAAVRSSRLPLDPAELGRRGGWWKAEQKLARTGQLAAVGTAVAGTAPPAAAYTDHIADTPAEMVAGIDIVVVVVVDIAVAGTAVAPLSASAGPTVLLSEPSLKDLEVDT